MDAVFRNTTNTTSVPSFWLANALAEYGVNQHLPPLHTRPAPADPPERRITF
jgi:hypothetical protein